MIIIEAQKYVTVSKLAHQMSRIDTFLGGGYFMDNIEIKMVKNKKDFKDFIKVQWKVYKNDNYWVPPLIVDMKTKFNPKKNPLFEHADIQSFVAYKHRKLAGRITGIIHNIHNEFHKEKTGFFGFFETIDDYDVANSLLNTVKIWLKDKGMDTMRGPANFSSNDDLGLLIEGFDYSPMIMMTYNPKYYVDFMDKYGFKKAKDLFAYRIDLTGDFNDRVKRIADMIKNKHNIIIRKVNMKDFDNEVKIVVVARTS